MLNGNNIAVVGGGITGLVTAIRLRHAKYEVTLLEKNETVCTETSAIVSEAHAGGEYPFDPQSGKDCLDGLLEIIYYLPPELFNNKALTRFFIANGSNVHTAQMRKHIEEVLKPHYATRIKEDPKYKLFGEPDEAFRELASEEFSDVNGVAAGFITPQKGYNSVYLATILKQYAEEIGVQFKFNHEVKSISPPFSPLNNIAQFRINSIYDEMEQEDYYDQTVIAAYYRGFELAKTVNPDYNPGEIHSAFREISIVETHAAAQPQSIIAGSSQIKAPSTCFTLLGHHGGMLSPVGPNAALIYHPGKTSGHIDSRSDVQIPEEWAKEIQQKQTSSRRARKTLAALKGGIYKRFLDNAHIVSTHKKIALNSSNNPEKRPNVGPQLVTPGCQDLSFATKATTSVLNATRATKACLAHSLTYETFDYLEYQDRLHNLETTKVSYPKKYQDNQTAFLDDAKVQAKKMNLPEGFIAPIASISGAMQIDMQPPFGAHSLDEIEKTNGKKRLNSKQPCFSLSDKIEPCANSKKMLTGSAPVPKVQLKSVTKTQTPLLKKHYALRSRHIQHTHPEKAPPSVAVKPIFVN